MFSAISFTYLLGLAFLLWLVFLWGRFWGRHGF